MNYNEENIIRLKTIKDDLNDIYQIDIDQIKGFNGSILKAKYQEFTTLVDCMIVTEQQEVENKKVEFTTPMDVQKKWTNKDYKYFRQMNEDGKVKSITYAVDKEIGKPVKGSDSISW